MEISEAQYRRIEPILPRQRGNVSMSNLTVLNAILYVAEQGCKWRGLPQTFRKLAHHLHPHEPLGQERRAGQHLREIAARTDRAHQDRGRFPGLDHRQSASRRHRGVKKNGPQAIGKSRGGWTTKIHLVAANARTAITFALSPDQASDAKAGRELLAGLGPLPAPRRTTRPGNWPWISALFL